MRLPAEYYSSIRKRNVQFCECNIKIRFHILKPELSRAFAKELINLCKQIKRKALYNIISIILIIIGLNH